MINKTRERYFAMGLLGNALSSLREARNQRKKRNFKMAIFLFAHFLELIFKHKLFSSDRQLIIKRTKTGPKKAKHRKTLTISFSESIDLMIDKKLMNPEVWADQPKFEIIDELKDLRNQIAHSGFAFSIAEEALRMGRLYDFIVYPNDCFDIPALRKELSKNKYRVFLEDQKVFKARQKNAEKIYKNLVPSFKDIQNGDEGPMSRLEHLECSYCGSYGSLYRRPDGHFQCNSCGEIQSQEYFHQCPHCGSFYTCFNEEDYLSVCPNCYHYALAREP